MRVKLNDVVFREDLYPRIETNPVAVQKYAETLEVLPPIELNQHRELIDGWHRWTAHKKAGVEDIEATILETRSDAHLLELAIERNAKHGLQLSQEDKRSMARKIYHTTPEKERDEKKKQLEKILSVSGRTVRDWLSRIDKDTKDARNKKIFDLWMSCHTQEEIAGMVGVTHQEVSREILHQTADLPKSANPAASHLTDFTPPLYNIWKQQEKTPGSSHYGNSEVRWVDNLLYLYTKPFDVVVDPFAGGGSTIDICKKRFRRYYVSDRKPLVERAKEVREWDITKGLPQLPRWKDVKLIYLDPPYWKQAEGKYSSDTEDLANMELPRFNETLSSLINSFAKKLTDAYIALLIQPTQWLSENKQFNDHVGDMLRMVNLPVEMRFSCPYESQQYNAAQVTWAQENKKCLVLTRELVVWRTT